MVGFANLRLFAGIPAVPIFPVSDLGDRVSRHGISWYTGW